MSTGRKQRLALMLLCATTVAGCAHTPPDDPADPLEPVNRVVYSFNTTVDRYALRPVTKAYVKVTPEPVRSGVSRFFGNLFYPITIANGFLQGKFAQGASDTGRFLINSTLGLVGIFDVAGPQFGLEEHREDLGQTLGYWGVGEGWYLMLPLFGPATNRDFVGRIGDTTFNPLTYADLEMPERIGVGVAVAVDTRSRLLETDRVVEDSFDPYTFVRGAYLQRRLALVNDGKAPDQVTPGFEEVGPNFEDMNLQDMAP